jgi:hypothetical protein
MITAVCYCDDCQAAGRQIEALPGAQPVLDPDGGSAMVMFRKDRLRCVEGAERLTPVKLTPGSPTSRYVASCCNSAMYLGFDDFKHWADVYRNRVVGEPPRLQARACIKYRTVEADLPDDAPAYPSYPPGLILRLLGSKLKMMLGM